MSTENNTDPTNDKKLRLLALFERMLPLIDSIAGSLQWVLILGGLSMCWIGYWAFVLKHYAWWVTGLLVLFALIPLAVILQFWWSIVQLRDLPTIAGQMFGDAKNEIRSSIQGLQSGQTLKSSFFGAGKKLFSLGSMAMEARELMGSYISVTTLMNPFMLVLGVIALAWLGLLILFSWLLIFFV